MAPNSFVSKSLKDLPLLLFYSLALLARSNGVTSIHATSASEWPSLQKRNITYIAAYFKQMESFLILFSIFLLATSYYDRKINVK